MTLYHIFWCLQFQKEDCALLKHLTSKDSKMRSSSNDFQTKRKLKSLNSHNTVALLLLCYILTQNVAMIIPTLIILTVKIPGNYIL